MNHAVEFFDGQFKRQIELAQYTLNPFEEAALPHFSGRVLDFGCGIGNLSIALAQRGCDVLAIDASPAGVTALAERARSARLPVTAQAADAARYEPVEVFGGIACIGLLMFFDCSTARTVLTRLQAALWPGGILAFNVLIEGTTFMDMFDPASHCLWRAGEIDAAFAGWETLYQQDADFPARDNLVKRFRTLVARKPANAG
jgi:tellurite methyltransferase